MPRLAVLLVVIVLAGSHAHDTLPARTKACLPETYQPTVIRAVLDE